jgi:hypothetical protein
LRENLLFDIKIKSPVVAFHYPGEIKKGAGRGATPTILQQNTTHTAEWKDPADVFNRREFGC